MATGIKNLIDDAYNSGKFCHSTFRKVSPTSVGTGITYDLSMGTGNPPPNYYIGQQFTATIPNEWYKKGIWHGGAVWPEKKYLHKICMIATSATNPSTFILCDYLLYYPLIDMDSTDEQLLINYGESYTSTTDPTAAVLPRYQDGAGVKAFIVATNPYIGTQNFLIKYTNSEGISGRISKVSNTNNTSYIGTLVNSFNTAGVGRYGPFIELKEGDIGIRSVESITFLGSNGGLCSLVMVKPIAMLTTINSTAWSEFDFLKLKPSLPRIYDGAFLGFLITGSCGSIVSVFGEITTIWGD